MKFIVPKSVLLDALTIVGKAIASKSIIPVLDNYLFEIDNDILKITGSNNEVSITTAIEISGRDFKKAISMPSAQLIGLVKDLPDQPIEFNIEERELNKETIYTIRIVAGKGKYTIPAEDGSYYPGIANENPVKFDFDAETLIKGIEKTLFAVSTDTLKPALTGIYISFADGKVTFTGTNAHILSTFTYDVATDSDKDFIIPAKVLSIIASIPRDENFTISIDKRSVCFQVNEDTIVKSLLIDERYPDYKFHIPTNNTNELVVEKSELIGAIKRVSKFSDSITNLVKVSITASSMVLSAENPDYGADANEEIAHSYTGEDLTIGLSGKQVIDCLNKLNTKEVYFYFSEARRAAIIREAAADPADITNLMMTMPLFLITNE